MSKTRKLAASIAVMAVTLGLIGAGVAASFSDNATASQRIDIGVLDITLASDTQGAQVTDGGSTLTCPAIFVTDSAFGWDTVGCHIQIVSAGSIAPDRVNVSVSVSSNGADLSHFMFMNNWGAGNWTPAENGQGSTPSLDTISGLLGTTTVVPADMYTYLGQHELFNGDMGKWIVVTYSIEAVA